jgi:hypothetical protein
MYDVASAGRIKDTNLLEILKCGHDFKDVCIEKWVHVNNACSMGKLITA